MQDPAVAARVELGEELGPLGALLVAQCFQMPAQLVQRERVADL